MIMTSPVTAPAFVLPAVSLWRREVVRFLRQRSRLVGALVTPAVFWLLIGSGLRNSFQVSGGGSMNFLEYTYPGTLVLIVLFTSIFASISIIQDRDDGFLQSVLVAPIRRSAIVVGKILGGTSLALFQAVLFLLVAPLVGVPLSIPALLAAFAVLVLVSLGLSAFGFLMAWPIESTQGYHAVMNLILMPMWALSGAFFPASGASRWVQWVMAINPLTYGVAALRQALYLGSGRGVPSTPSPVWSVCVTAAFAVLMTVLASRAVGRQK